MGAQSVYMKVSYSAKPILSQELSLFVVAGHIESSNAGLFEPQSLMLNIKILFKRRVATWHDTRKLREEENWTGEGGEGGNDLNCEQGDCYQNPVTLLKLRLNQRLKQQN